MENLIKGGIIGSIVGDALGVPVEFMGRSRIAENPVTDMREYGTHNQPKGTWSDDSSMMLATLDSLSNGYNPVDIMDKFVAWVENAEFTPHGEVFDIGRTTLVSISRYERGNSISECGGYGENDNGNGSLMRILPISIYAFFSNEMADKTDKEKIELIHTVSALTHGHLRSKIACGIYSFIIKNIIKLRDLSKEDVVKESIKEAFNFYKEYEELKYFKDLENVEEFKNLSENEIKSSGYVLDTLEASIWCFLNTSSYKECVLKAVNLGDDTDTTGMVAGGIAGCFYGYDNISENWIECICKLQWIKEISEKFINSL